MKLKQIAVFLLAFFLLLITTGNETVAQTAIKAKPVDYVLPHPGMLPDNPLYALKKTRDSLLIFFTRDNVKKAVVHLLLSDKKIQMAEELSTKGKWKLSMETASEAEDHSIRILDNLLAAKKQGVSAPTGFLHDFKLSTEKHRELLEDLLAQAPSDQRKGFEEVLKQNRTVGMQISKL
jgi:hypothetical protein